MTYFMPLLEIKFPHTTRSVALRIKSIVKAGIWSVQEQFWYTVSPSYTRATTALASPASWRTRAQELPPAHHAAPGPTSTQLVCL